ncbi:Protein yae1 [Penicillium macrosclerotiorum]|uniref:Protein yae1 n=1 Tax=Penicillium macrosclerotiorum TaxID=303699 RepID=UPI002548591D|nr:Protein yae1 [Penicillium macrosclerotiorum]KAJ5692300.1 Protein yae1 [Penicillium macrosclerotiorum]
MTSTHSTDAPPPPVDNSLDDIFGSSPPQEARAPALSHQMDAASSTEPSDLPSLRRQHVTAGYRDGVSTSKGEHVQRGFDAGFPVGAQLGMRAGTVLGILEGIARGLEDRGVVKKPAARGSARTDERNAEAEATRRQVREQVLRLYQEATAALDVQAVFTGIGAGVDAEAGELAETQLGKKGDVAVARWEERVAVPQWEENMEKLEMKESQVSKEGDKGVEERS